MVEDTRLEEENALKGREGVAENSGAISTMYVMSVFLLLLLLCGELERMMNYCV